MLYARNRHGKYLPKNWKLWKRGRKRRERGNYTHTHININRRPSIQPERNIYPLAGPSQGSKNGGLTNARPCELAQGGGIPPECDQNRFDSISNTFAVLFFVTLLVTPPLSIRVCNVTVTYMPCNSLSSIK